MSCLFGILAVIFLIGAPLVSAQEPDASYPFADVVGEWKLKDDRFQQVWDGAP